MTIARIAFIGFGEVGQSLAQALKGTSAFSAYDPKFVAGDTATLDAAQRLDVAVRHAATDAADNADLVISAVTAAQTVTAISSIAASVKTNAWVLDVNSASPEAKIAAAKMIHASGARYIESSIMAPINPKRLAAPILLGGPHAATFESVAADLGFTNAQFYSDIPGKAAAAKLCRSVVVKGIEALIAESLLAARHYGVEDHVLASLDNLFPHEDWRAYAQYMIGRSLLHGQRRAEEMHEAARTVSDANVSPWMSNATVLRQAWASDLSLNNPDLDLSSLLDAIRNVTPSTEDQPLEAQQ